MYIVYGIKNCDTVKKALRWLDDHNINYEFHDFKTRGITDSHLKNWSDQLGWEDLINRKGLTWKQLPEEVRNSVISEKAAFSLMKEKTSMIKRPVVELDGKVLARGFDERDYLAAFGESV